MASARILYCALFFGMVYLPRNGVICRDIFTAYNHMAKLASVEIELHQALEDYISSEDTKLMELRAFAKIIATARQLKSDATTTLPDYASNPIRAYLMMKRFVWHWRQIKQKIDGEKGIVIECSFYAYNLTRNFIGKIISCL